MDDTIYRGKPNRVDRVNEPDDELAHLADEADDWEQTTEVTRLREEMEEHLQKSERRLSGIAGKIEELRRWANEPPIFEGA